MTSPLNLTQAVEVLTRLQAAAPPATAAKLTGVMELLHSLSDENAYLSTLLLEAPTAVPASPAAFTAAPTVTGMLRQSVNEDPHLTFLSGVAENLRPPLVAIRGRAELVQAGLLGQITPEQDTWLGAVQDNTARAFALLDAVDEMIALERGQVKISPVNFISTDLLTEGWERIRDRARTFQHEITIHAPDVVPLARGDFYQSLIILTDLLDNATRYTSAGGQIRMSVDNLGTHVLFSVADNGIGLADDDLSHIGRPFWRGEHYRPVRAHNGAGLRLYLARRVLALQEGELIFSGQLGLGSTFSFTLPVPS